MNMQAKTVQARHDEWKSTAPGLDSLDDADRIRARLVTAFEEAERYALCANANQDLIQQLLTFVLANRFMVMLRWFLQFITRRREVGPVAADLTRAPSHSPKPSTNP